jgi:hypothetical protein
MKRTLSIILILVLLSLSLVSCAKGNKFTSSGAAFVDKKTKVTYDFAPSCYEPIAIGEKIYGTDGDIDFYEISGQDPEKWLGDADGGVFYAKGITLPTVDKMNVARLELCTVKNQVVVAKRITDTEVISAIIDGYLSESKILYPNKTASVSYKLRFADTTIGVYYCVDFVRYAEDYVLTIDGVETNLGKDFLYNRAEDRFIKAPEALVSEINALLGVGS